MIIYILEKPDLTGFLNCLKIIMDIYRRLTASKGPIRSTNNQ